MAFWLASPLMDPAMFLITAGTLGFDFAIAKTAAAVGLGLMGGFAVKAGARSILLADPLRETPAKAGCGCSGSSPFDGRPVWKFWPEASRRAVFRDTVIENALFLGKWLLLAYLVEALMITYVPAEWIASVLGGDGLKPVLLGAIVGAPAYLNGYAAVPLVDALLAQGMSNGAAMSFRDRRRRKLYSGGHRSLGARETPRLRRLPDARTCWRGTGRDDLAGDRLRCVPPAGWQHIVGGQIAQN